MTRKQRSFVFEAVLECLARAPRGVTPSEIFDYLLENYVAELEPLRETLFRKGLLSQIKHYLRTTALDDGIDGEEDPVQKVLPGFRAPSTLGISQGNGEYRYIRFEACTKEDFLKAIETREEGIFRDMKRLDDLKEKYKVLEPYLSTDSTMTVERAISLYRANA